MARFPCLRLAFEAGQRGGTAPAVLVGADEQAVALFLAGKIGFTDIAAATEAALAAHAVVDDPDIPAIIAAGDWAQAEVRRWCGLDGGTQAPASA